MKPVFILVHSPLVGPVTWHATAGCLESAGHPTRVPSLLGACEGALPYWPRIVDAVRDGLTQMPDDTPLVLVAHSSAGLFLPTIRSGLMPRSVIASIFVDAALPARSGSTSPTSPQRLEFLRRTAVDGRLPRWTDWWDETEVARLFPDEATRQAVVAEQPNLPLAYYEQRVPVPDGWDDHPCSYLLFSAPYDRRATEARERGWRVEHLPGGHLNQLVDPEGTAARLLALAAGS